MNNNEIKEKLKSILTKKTSCWLEEAKWRKKKRNKTNVNTFMNRDEKYATNRAHEGIPFSCSV
jgi:predicted hydrolase (HD superfamily)